MGLINHPRRSPPQLGPDRPKEPPPRGANSQPSVRPRTRNRNIRLAAVHLFFHYCALRHPEHAALIRRVLAIPPLRAEKRTITLLSPQEVGALLDSPTARPGPDAATTRCCAPPCRQGLRVSELLALTRADAHLASGPHVRALGKGRKERVAPLTRQTVAVLHVWMRQTAGEPEGSLFPSRHGGPLTRDGIERRLAKHVATAEHRCATLRAKHISMHTLRHTAAMTLLNAGIDTSTIALWLGHEHVYLHADLALKQRTLDRITPPNGRPGRYRAPDTLLAFLEGL